MGFTLLQLQLELVQQLAAVAQGLSDDKIAQKLGVSRNTVQNHVSAIHKAADARKRSALVVRARERGLGTSLKPVVKQGAIKQPKS